jgi:Nif-specific regulatory protein
MPSSALQARRAHLELITVYEISRVLCGGLDVVQRFPSALRIAVAQLELQLALLALPSDSEPALQVHSGVGLTPEQWRRGRWRAGSGIVGQVFDTGVPATVVDLTQARESADPDGVFGTAPDSPLALAVVPLRIDGTTVGVLAACRVLRADARLADDLRVLTMLASLMAQALRLREVVTHEQRRLRQESTRLRQALRRSRPPQWGLEHVIGNSLLMQQVCAEVHRAAPSRSTVLIRGESGTGKEAIAQAVHALSPRRDAPFVKVNCAALSESLLESELFGHERGAFTGAVGERRGRFELAHGGTLFLDEIGDISAAFQAKLLRVLQEREFERVGGSRSVKVDIRLVCATNRDLENMVEEGSYRADLYYRINVIPIFLPALRERADDIPALAEHFVARFNAENQRSLRITPEAMRALVAHRWPGNVRELENCIERAAIMAHGDTIDAVNVRVDVS